MGAKTKNEFTEMRAMTSTDNARELLERVEEHLGQALPAWHEIADAVGLAGDDGALPLLPQPVVFARRIPLPATTAPRL